VWVGDRDPGVRRPDRSAGRGPTIRHGCGLVEQQAFNTGKRADGQGADALDALCWATGRICSLSQRATGFAHQAVNSVARTKEGDTTMEWDVTLRELPSVREVCAGGVLFVAAHRNTVILLHHHNGKWMMPKGHLARGETAAQAALREVSEETGLHAQIVAKVGTTHYTIRSHGNNGLIDRVVHWYLMEVSEVHVVLEPRFDRVLLVHVVDATDLLTYPADRAIVREAWRLRSAQAHTSDQLSGIVARS